MFPGVALIRVSWLRTVTPVFLPLWTPLPFSYWVMSFSYLFFHIALSDPFSYRFIS